MLCLSDWYVETLYSSERGLETLIDVTKTEENVNKNICGQCFVSASWLVVWNIALFTNFKFLQKRTLLTIEVSFDEQREHSEEDGEREDDAVQESQYGIANDEDKLSLTEVLCCHTIVIRRLSSSAIGCVIHVDASTANPEGHLS